MNQGFKLRFDQLRDNDPTGSADKSESSLVEQYPTQGHTRNVCLVWPDGKRVFFNYAYLVVGEFEPNDDKNVIKLGFSSHRVVLQGYGLEALFIELMDHLPRVITLADARYSSPNDNDSRIVISAMVEYNG